MKIEISTKQVLRVLYIIAWIIFVGVSIEAGGFLFNTFFVLVMNPAGANNFWEGLDMSDLLKHDRGHFFVVTLLMSIVAVLRCCLFYVIIKILHDKKIDFSQPFSNRLRGFISMLSFVALLIGLFSNYGVKYTEWLGKKGVNIPDTQYLRLGGADVWLFMCVILFVIAQIFKRGIELQTENELTI